MKRLLPLGLIAVVLGGCEQLPAIQADGRCGNRILEPSQGEDCDNGDASELPDGTLCGVPGTVEACRFVCQPGAMPDSPPVVECPTGYACGNDTICRAPSGRFEQSVVLPVSFANMAIGDVDGDRYPDLIASQEPSLIVRLGNAQGTFSAEREVAVNASTSAAVLLDLDRDEFDDVVVFDNRDIQIYRGSTGGELFPQATPLASLPEISPNVYLVSARVGGGLFPEPLLVDFYDVGLAVAVPLVSPNNPPVALFESEALFEEEAFLSLRNIGIGDLDRANIDDETRTEEIAIARTGDAEVLVVEIDCGPNVSMTMECDFNERAILELPDGLVVQSGGTFIVETDDRVELFVVAFDPNAEPMMGMRGPMSADMVVLLRSAWDGEAFAPLAEMRNFHGVCNMMPCDLLTATVHDIAPFGSGEEPLFLTHTGIWRTGNNPMDTAVRNSSGVEGGQFVDVNNDGRLDAVTHAGGTLFTLLQMEPIGVGRSFSEIESSIASGIDYIEVADMNGDLFPDIVVGGPDGLRLAINDGTGVIGREEVILDDFDDFSITTLPWRLPGNERVADLVAVGEGGSGTELFLFNGSGTGRIAAPYRTSVEIVGMTGIRLGGQPALFIAGSDMSNEGGQMGGPPSAAYAVIITEDGETDSPNRTMTALAHDGCPFDLGGVPNLTLKAVDLDDDGTSELVMAYEEPVMGPGATRSRIDLLRIADGQLTCTLLALNPLPTEVESLEVLDLDGDSALDLLVVQEPRPPNSPDEEEAQNGTLVVWSIDGPNPELLLITADVADELGDELRAIGLPIEGAEYSGLVAPITIDGDPRPALIVGSDEGSLVVRLSREGVEPLYTLDVDMEMSEVRALVVSDTNGDGLDDVIVRQLDEILVHVQQPCGAGLEDDGFACPEAP